MEIVLATRNSGKVKEFKALLASLGVTVLSLEDYQWVPEVEEDGSTFKENAEKKALVVARATGKIAVADDSGLEVDFLGGAPGVHSARFAGPERDDGANNRKLLQLMEGVPPEQRSARFCCVVAVGTPEGKVHTAMGTCPGVILQKPAGEGGFGYDPLFFIPEYGQTFAQLELNVKNKISHRGKAFALAANIITQLVNVAEI